MRDVDRKRWNKFIDKLQGKEEKADYHIMSLCPAHGDANVSLWVQMNEKGVIMMKCHAGCTNADVVEKMGFRMSILFSDVKEILGIFEFLALNGELIYQEVKYDKTSMHPFVARRPNKNAKSEKDKWIWDIKGLQLILYNLMEISKVTEGGIVGMMEGAKDAETLRRLGIPATAALFNNWRDTDTTLLDDKHIIIFVDNDDAGELKALTAAHDRRGKSKSIKMMRLPGLPQSGDVTDWVKAGGTKERLLELMSAKDLKEWYPEESVRKCIEGELMTGLSFEHNYPRPIFNQYLATFHPSEKGLLYYYDGEWYKGNPNSKSFAESLKNHLL